MIKEKIYQFSSKDAEKYGLEEAVMLWNLLYWIEKNEANKRHYHDGRFWTYNSAEAFSKLFPFWNAGKIRRILKSLQEQGAILIGNYNQSAYDRTAWYALSDSYLESVSAHYSNLKNASFKNDNIDYSNLENGSIKNETPIPDINTNEIQNTLFPEVNKEKKRGTSESLCLFANSRYSNFEEFKKCFASEDYKDIDIAYYFESVKDWSSASGKKKRDWIATARNFMRSDKANGKLKTIPKDYNTEFGLPQGAIDYLRMGSDE